MTAPRLIGDAEFLALGDWAAEVFKDSRATTTPTMDAKGAPVRWVRGPLTTKSDLIVQLVEQHGLPPVVAADRIGADRTLYSFVKRKRRIRGVCVCCGQYLPKGPASAPRERAVDVHEILRQADEQRQARAEQLPTEQDCIRLMVQCRLRLEELDWRSIDYAPKQKGKPIDAIVPGWPGVKECHWLGSSWFAAEAGDLWPVEPAWFKVRAQ